MDRVKLDLAFDEGVTRRSDATVVDSGDSVASPLRELTSDLPRDKLGRLDRFELIREIGRGGYGIVYLAEDTQLGRQVAIKIARPEVVLDEIGIDRFNKESRAAATLEHPGIVQVFECGEANGLHYYVMPYHECDSLAQWLVKAKQPIDERFAAQLILDCAEAIQFGHEQGIIHRDLKPQNILLKPDPNRPNGFRPIVLDFGLCGYLESGDGSTSMLAGTPRYMSPEQAMFGHRKITGRSDIYSLGVILYQLLAGQPPHQPQSISEAILLLHNTPVDSPCIHRVDLSPELEAICLQCLRKDHDRRYRTAKSLAEDLRRFIDGVPVTARRAGLWERFDFALRFGDWEPRLGLALIAMNLACFAWTVAGAVVIVRQFPNDQNVVEGFNELFAFLGLIATPAHAAGAFAGWKMLKQRQRSRAFLLGTVVCALWTSYLWFVYSSGKPFLRVYTNQGYTQWMVFLLIGAGFTVQTLFLAIGTWTAYRREQSLEN
jgi:eukaryotic-like serine/threonine-protein kinase